MFSKRCTAQPEEEQTSALQTAKVTAWSFVNICLHLQVKVGDTLDLIVEEDKEEDAVTLKRVVLKKIVGETNNGEKLKVLLRTWKHLQLPKRDAFRE